MGIFLSLRLLTGKARQVFFERTHLVEDQLPDKSGRRLSGCGRPLFRCTRLARLVHQQHQPDDDKH